MGSKEEPSPYVSLADPPLSCILDGDYIVIYDTEIMVAVSYPLRKEFVFTVKAPDGAQGFSRCSLVQAISDLYKDIYDDDGRYYGVWGHHLDDLELHTVLYDEERKVYTLLIDS